ncbi:MAG: carboxypeptidase regulatory-like domain-containing protein [Planctomycetota bacterium]
MKAKLLLSVAALTGVALVLWTLFSDPSAGGAGPTDAARGEAAEPASEDGPGPELDGADLAGAAEAGGARVAQETPDEADDAAPTWDEDDTLWLDVRVVRPDATPGGERVHVAAYSRSLGRERLFGGDGALARLAAGEEARLSDRLLATAEVAADGTARLALLPGTERVWLAAGGSFVYVDEPVEVALAPGTGGEPAVVHTLLGALVEGTMTGPGGEPAAGIELDLEWSLNAALQLGGADAARVARDTTSADDGRFVFRAVPVGRALFIETEEDELARHFTEDVTPVAGERVRVDLALFEGGVVRGRIVDAQGAPIAGADVTSLGRSFFGNPTEDLGDAKTEEDGTFEIVRVTPGKVWVNVKCDGYPDDLSEPFEVENGRVLDVGTIELDPGLALAGVVRFDDGEPAVGAELALSPDLSENLAGSPVDPRTYTGADEEATTDDGGRFVLAGLGEGPWIVEATFREGQDTEGVASDEMSAAVDEALSGVAAELGVEPGAAPAPPAPAPSTGRARGRWYGEVSLARAPAEGLEITLMAPITLSGEVVDSEGEPVSSFVVNGERAGSQWYMPPSDTRTQSFESEDGTFVLDGLRPGPWSFTVEAEGMATLEALSLTLPDETVQRFVLQRSITIRGLVFDPLGEPVAGAEIGPELEGAELVAAMQGRGDHPSATSDGEGRFVLVGLSPGAGSIAAKKDGWAPSEPFGYELGEGEGEDDVRLTLRVGGTISGEVYDAEGGAAKDCVVIVQLPTLEERRFTNADSSGRFEETGLKPGTYQVQAFPGIESLDGTVDQAALMGALKMATVKLDDGASEHVVLGAPPAEPVRVSGVVSVGGEPLEGIIVSFIPSSGGGMENLKIETTGADGRYEVTVDEPGSYRVTAQTSGQPLQQNSVEFVRTVPEKESHELDLEMPMGRITGRVTGPDGEAAVGARVTLTMQSGQVFGTIMGGQYDETRTGSDGTYEIRFVRPGTYTVAAGGALLGGAFGTSGAEAQALGRSMRTATVSKSGSVSLDFELTEPGNVTGVVRDAAGKPVGNASIFLRDEEGRLVELFSFQATNASGKFDYDGLAPGNYTITARADGQASTGTDTVRVRSGETTEATVTVDSGTTLVVSLSDKSGANVQSQVSVRDERGREMNGMLSLEALMERATGGAEDSAQRIGPLPPGRYTVEATAADGRTAKRRVRLDGQAQKKLRLRLK